ncbi:hypothetical protein PFICI_10692 [Pestalotiopsis fici W106-1]|uniref:MalT-like TPR region domain-containing protein n=1 Tax=Pestalotiopsis fici (strain W106-1 / CGMCC3.15140) TaxID=1229662 RepID=W3WXR5_PESFW|nr:uncharacterized protein PFICI_10692 [Pestalotiopsis fici W106-1]ETS78630.1 hypothetical protein PFICI_10692 [Pestalotiopsis fici W106-1]
MRSELEDWKLALGHDHWIVLNRLSSITLFELARQPRQALQTAQAAYDLASSQSASALAAIQEARLNLAIAYEANGMMDSAGKLAKEFIHILEQPSDSQAAAMSSNFAPNTDLQQIIALARARSILASVFESTSKLPEAENLRREVLSDVTEALGETHGLSLEYTSRLAQLLFDHGKKKESRQLFKRVEDKASSSWSSNHDLALLARQNLHRAPHPFWWYHRRSHPERFRKEMIENYQLTVGNYNRNTIAAMDSCVQILLQEFRWEEALNLMEHAVALSAFAYRDDPKQIHIYQENLKNVRRMCFWSSTKISQWFIKYRFGYTIMPYHLFRPIGTEEFQRRYQHAWGPFYRVKTMFEAKDFYRFDPYKDPDHPGNNEMVAAD